MLQIASTATQKLRGVLAGTDGVPGAIAALCEQEGFQLPAVTPQQIISQNVAAEISERSTASKYPLVYVFCSKIINQLREKFRIFSGEAQMVVEARVSQDRLDDLETNVQAYVSAIVQVLDQSRGDWGDGVFYGGGYEASFGAVKQGGRNFLQIAKVTFVLQISTD